jgi:hypothetical protein
MQKSYRPTPKELAFLQRLLAQGAITEAREAASPEAESLTYQGFLSTSYAAGVWTFRLPENLAAREEFDLWFAQIEWEIEQEQAARARFPSRYERI